MKMTQQKQRAAVMAMMRDRRVEVREGQQEKERRNLVRHVLRILSSLLRLHLNLYALRVRACPRICVCAWASMHVRIDTYTCACKRCICVYLRIAANQRLGLPRDCCPQLFCKLVNERAYSNFPRTFHGCAYLITTNIPLALPRSLARLLARCACVC